MSFTVNVPGPLRDVAGGRSRLTLDGEPRDAGDALAILFASYPALRQRVVDETGEVRTHVSIFVGDENVRHLSGMKTPVPDGAELTILPALSGG